MKPILLAIALFVSSLSFSFTYTTASDGYWQDPASWTGGIVPAYNASDTILVDHHIGLDSNLTLTAGSYMNISVFGGICGHVTFEVVSSTVDSYSLIEVDSLIINSGTVVGHAGWITITTSAHIFGSGGGGLSLSGAGLAVGPWFDCPMPDYDFTLSIEDNFDDLFEVYPVPFKNNIYLGGLLPQEKYTIEILDITGKVLRSLPASLSEILEIETGDIPAGSLIVRVISENAVYSKLIVKG